MVKLDTTVMVMISGNTVWTRLLLTLSDTFHGHACASGAILASKGTMVLVFVSFEGFEGKLAWRRSVCVEGVYICSALSATSN